MVSWCLRNFPQDAQGTFHKEANHMVTAQQPELKPPLEMHHTDFVSPGFWFGYIFFFSFLFSSRESEPGMLRWKDGSLLAALKILPNHTLFS